VSEQIAGLAQTVADLHRRLCDEQVQGLVARDLLRASLDLAHEQYTELQRLHRQISNLRNQLRRERTAA
jgi:hypothetical protein